MSELNVPRFSELGLAEPVLRAVEEVGYEMPSPIQAAAIGPLLAGRDLLGQAQTGTGKTAAFALPLLSNIALDVHKPQLLILTPTRELAIQVAEAIQTYARYLPGFHVLPIYGGQSYSLQLRPLRRGVHAVVGTPGRVLDHLRRGSLALDAIRTLVLDEADEMLRMGFIDDVEDVLQRIPNKTQLALFSATMPSSIRNIAHRHTTDPAEIKIEAKTATVDTVTQQYWQVSGLHKLDALTRILETEDFDGMVVFVRTKIATSELAERLEARGFSSAPLNGDMNQATREQTIERLKAGRLDILVATDVAARGLDVDRISHVVNYDVPHDTEAYVHRIGRTARAGRKGKAILFIAPRERRMLRSIERATGKTIEAMTLPTVSDVEDKRAARFKESIAAVLNSQELQRYEVVLEELCAEQDEPMSRIAAALAYMAQGERTPLKEDAKPGKRDRDDERRPKKGGKERSEAGDRKPKRSQRSRDPVQAEDGFVSYRLEVGSEHNVMPKNIVGAIANEAGLDAMHIGAIRIFEEHSFVDLPEGMPREIFEHLRRVRVANRPLKLSIARPDGAPSSNSDDSKEGSSQDGGANELKSSERRARNEGSRNDQAGADGAVSDDKRPRRPDVGDKKPRKIKLRDQTRTSDGRKPAKRKGPKSDSKKARKKKES